jgi:hypothetical protein
MVDVAFPGTLDTVEPSAGPEVEENARMSGILSVLGVLCFALFLNSSLSAVLECLHSDTSRIRTVIPVSMALSALLYFLLAVSVSSTFGPKTLSPANLHWVGFRWPSNLESCAAGAGTLCDYSAKVVEVLVLLFPALDVLSVYSINCIILTQNLLESVGSDALGTVAETLPLIGKGAQPKKKRCFGGKGSITDTVHELVHPHHARERMDKVEKFTLVFMTLSPIVCAIMLPGFSKIIVYTGAISIVLCLVYPALFGIKLGALKQTQGVQSSLTKEWGVMTIGSLLTVIILGGQMLLPTSP